MIEINNLTTNPIEEDFLKKTANLVLEKEGKKGFDLSIALVGRERIRTINKRYRGKNRATDVLAFPEVNIQKEKFKIGPAEKSRGLGEIIICIREVKKNAKRMNLPFKKELATCLIHGILHLLGYDHEVNPEKAREMEERQKYYLSRIFL